MAYRYKVKVAKVAYRYKVKVAKVAYRHKMKVPKWPTGTMSRWPK